MFKLSRQYRLLLISAFFLTSCSMISGHDAEGQYVDDSTITAQVKQALAGNAKTKSCQINVETSHGTVQLSGFVDSPQSEADAVELTHRVNGVKVVEDVIIVRPYILE